MWYFCVVPTQIPFYHLSQINRMQFCQWIWIIVFAVNMTGFYCENVKIGMFRISNCRSSKKNKFNQNIHTKQWWQLLHVNSLVLYFKDAIFSKLIILLANISKDNIRLKFHEGIQNLRYRNLETLTIKTIDPLLKWSDSV